MYTVHLDILGINHDFRLIADIESFDTRKAGPFLTPPLYYLLNVTMISGQSLPIVMRQLSS